jgi:hypothetical protein
VEKSTRTGRVEILARGRHHTCGVGLGREDTVLQHSRAMALSPLHQQFAGSRFGSQPQRHLWGEITLRLLMSTGATVVRRSCLFLGRIFAFSEKHLFSDMVFSAQTGSQHSASLRDPRQRPDSSYPCPWQFPVTVSLVTLPPKSGSAKSKYRSFPSSRPLFWCARLPAGLRTGFRRALAVTLVGAALHRPNDSLTGMRHPVDADRCNGK